MAKKLNVELLDYQNGTYSITVKNAKEAKCKEIFEAFEKEKPKCGKINKSSNQVMFNADKKNIEEVLNAFKKVTGLTDIPEGDVNKSTNV